MPMSDLSRATAVPGAVPPAAIAETQHPSTFAPATFVFLVVLCIFGAVIGVQLILQLGITPNTSIIGALVAMLLARVPGAIFARYRSIHVQNLAQSAISAATFGAANSLLLPIGVPFLLGRPDLIIPMLVGAALSMLLDGYLLYRMFDTRVFPAAGTWPPGVARPRRSAPAMPAAAAPCCLLSVSSSASPAAGSRSRCRPSASRSSAMSGP
jgi:hypothetical protein